MREEAEMGRLASIVGLCLAASTSAAPAQTYVVDASGSGDFSDLQVALDSVPDGSTLIVFGGWFGAKITRSVTMVGASDASGNKASIGGMIWGGGSGPNGAAVIVNAATDAIVTLSNLSIDPGFWDAQVHGIDVISVGFLVIRNCSVTAERQTLWDYDGSCSQPAHALFVENDATLIAVYGSSLYGVQGTTETNIDENNQSVRDVIVGGLGGDAIHAPDVTTIIVSESSLFGGDGGVADWGTGDGSGGHAPTELRGGDGGNAVTGAAFISAVQLNPGHSGGYTFRDTDWGNGELGSDGVDATNGDTDLGDRLAISGTPEPAGSLTITGSGFSAYRAGLIFLSTSLGNPAHLRQGTWFLGFPWFFAGAVPTDVGGGFTVSGTLPNDPAIVGLSISLQVADTEHLSEPELIVIEPQ
jgi:hypothetical protein